MEVRKQKFLKDNMNSFGWGGSLACDEHGLHQVAALGLTN